VIPPCATVVVACAGLEVIGKPLEERYVHRPELVAALAGQELGSTVGPATLARVLLHQQGGRKGLPAGARFFVLLNGASPALQPVAERVLSELAAAAELELTTLVCRRRQDDPVVDARLIRGEYL
jgi:probable selenium-dependent hydroxylase accessory protein YqeC